MRDFERIIFVTRLFKKNLIERGQAALPDLKFFFLTQNRLPSLEKEG